MLIDDAHRYVALRRSLGFKLEKTARHLDAFTRHAMANGDSHIRAAAVLAWTAAVSSTPGARYRRLQEIAVAAHRALGCRDLSRADFVLPEVGDPVLLEVNTLPGMTPTSLFPDAARAGGIGFEELTAHLVRRALERAPAGRERSS